MTNFQKLKHEARKAEQRSDWARAIELYCRALESDADMADLSLYNRIGDLHLRQGAAGEAVEYYEQAVEKYAANDMYTSAIALCNKILRIAPDRTSVYRRLGGLHARAGLLAEGRGNCLTYVRSALEQGSAHDALEAVEEFVAATGDEEIRLQFAELLADHDQQALAADQLSVVYRVRRARGSDAATILARIEALGGDDAAAQAEAAAEAAAEEAAAAEREPETPLRLADLVADALGDERESIGYAPDTPKPARPERPANDDELRDVRRGFAAFREEILDDVPEDDLRVHYDLGVELMTIGLVDEALTEFRAAVADPRLVEAATARIGECLVLQGSLATVMPPRGSPGTVTPPAPGVNFVLAGRPEATMPFTFAPPAASPEAAVDAGASDEVAPVEPTDVVAGEPRDVDDIESAAEAVSGDEDELQGHFFRARLAQYRIRRADERHTVDHAAHLDLGTAYVEMELWQEAVREYSVALNGPRKVARDAARALVGVAASEEALPELALHVLETLSGTDHPKAAARLGELLAAAWGDDHPYAERLVSARHASAAEELPSLEAMFPALDPDSSAEETPPESDTEETTDVAEPLVSQPSSFEKEDLAELDELLAQLDSVPEEEGRDTEGSAVEAELEEAQELRSAGDEGAAADLLTASLERLEAERRTREALRVLAALLELRPDDVMLHHHHAELALMANDRAASIAAYAGLGGCLCREEAFSSARAAYGRILDFDAGNEEARAAIAAIDANEIAAETRARKLDEMATPDPERSEFDELLQELDTNGEGPAGEVVASGESADGDPEANSHLELGLAFMQMGMWEEAIRELTAALDSLEDRLRALAALAESYVRAARPAEAVALLSDELRSDEDAEQVAALYWLGRALQDEGNAPEAHAVLARVEAASPGYRDAAGRLSELSL